MAAGPGHLFVIDGDVTRVDVDGLLVPTDRALRVERHWLSALGLEGDSAQHLDVPGDWNGRVMRYGDPRTRPSIWLGEIGAVDSDEGWYVDGAVEFVEKAAADLSDLGRPVPLRLALHVVGSGAGGSRHDKGRLFARLVPALMDTARRCEVDVVLVCWGDRPYSAAQRARRREVGDRWEQWWPFGAGGDQATLHGLAGRLATAARRGELVPFIGAGVSRGAGAPAWQELLDALYVEITSDDEDLVEFHQLDVRDQASYVHRLFVERHGDDGDRRYRESVSTKVRRERYGLGHGLLASLDAAESVTTNYDTLYESAVETAGRSLAVLPNRPAEDPDTRRWLLKLHGSIDDPAGIVLTREDYLGLPGRSGALFGIVQAMLMTRHMLFVGYSLSDDSFHRVVHEVRAARPAVSEPLGTALLLRPEPLLERLWSDDLTLQAVSGPHTPDAVASRELDLFLDLVGLHAADASAFLLDPTYSSMLDDGEREVAKRLASVAAVACDEPGPIGERVRAITRGLGSP